MATPWDLEHQIPIRRVDLARFLSAHSSVSTNEAPVIRQVFQGITALIHFDFLEDTENLKAHYMGLDPDLEVIPVASNGFSAGNLDKLQEGMRILLEKANYEKLNWDMVDTWLSQSKEFLGMKVKVNSEEFDRLLMYYRGECVMEKKIRRWWRPWKKDVVPIPGLSRLAIFIKMREKPRENAEVNTQKVFLKLFKNIPKTSVPMMFPGAQVKLNPFDKGLIGYPILAGFAMIFYNLLIGIFKVGIAALVGLTTWPLALAFGGYGYRTYYNYVYKKQDYDLRLTKNLYYQTLDSNSGVIARMADDAEEQESIEALVGYFCLLKFAPECGWDKGQLDDYAELFIQELIDRKVDFEIHDSLAKLNELGIVLNEGNKIRAVPLMQAREILARGWSTRYEKLGTLLGNDPPKEAEIIPQLRNQNA